jgi:hypothetical protein
MFCHPAFTLRDSRGIAQRQTFLAEQCVAAVAGRTIEPKPD